jgi:hypothetical protein
VHLPEGGRSGASSEPLCDDPPETDRFRAPGRQQWQRNPVGWGRREAACGVAVQNPREGSQCYPIAPSGRWKASEGVMRTMDHKRRAGCGESRTSGSEGGQRETRLRRDHVS